MPATPVTSKSLTKSSVDILNAIRNSASANYRDYVPAANASQDNIREIGAIIMNYPALQNEFLSALVNRIGRVLITSKSYANPWAAFKKGILEFGETIEEIFVNIAKPFEYDPSAAASYVFRREIPDVRAAFHILNYQKFYKATIQNEQLRQAFLNWNGITDLIAKIVDSMYTAANYDEFQTMKYMLAKHILQGELYPTQVSAATAANAKSIVTAVKGASNNYEFMSTKYNQAGVANYSMKDNQYLIVTADFDAIMDVEVLASAFNMSKAEFMGHRILIDSFGELDTTRLGQLFANDANYTALTSDELTALKAIPAVLVDADYFMIFDNLFNFTEQYNGEGLYWNYWYHAWKTFSVSPFANATVFVPAAPAVSSVTVSPSTATIIGGQKVLLTATVATTNFASQKVVWSWTSTDGDASTPQDTTAANTGKIEVDIYGEVWVDASVATGTEITVIATSVVDNAKYDGAVITVG